MAPAVRIIDLHAHVYPDGSLADIVKGRPEFEIVESPRGGQVLLYRGSHVMSLPRGQDDLKKRLDGMDEVGVEFQVLSVGPVNIGWAGSKEAAAARKINDGLAEACRQHSGRFRFVAALPLANRTEMLAELERALSLGAVGVGITTTIEDQTLDAPSLGDFWREADKQKLLVLVHPTFPPNGPRQDQGQFLTVGYLGETAMAATRLVLSGALEKNPNVRIVWSHLGGSLSILIDRLDRSYRRYESCPRPPSYYLRRCFYDTACAHGPALDCARATFGASALVFGTDEPHVPNAAKDNLAAVQGRPWPSSDVEAVLRGNAQRLVI